jgi:hypothetical protein
MDLLAKARQTVEDFEANDLSGFPEEKPGDWSLRNWLTNAWFPKLAVRAGTERHVGRAWMVNDRIARVAIVGERGEMFASIRYAEDGSINGLVLGDKERNESGPPFGISISCPPDRWFELMDFCGKLFPVLSFSLMLDADSAYVPPRWPDPEQPQQLHLDIFVPDLDRGEEIALANGASRLPELSRGCRTFADPVGHPFCLYADVFSRRAWPTDAYGVLARIVLDCADPEELATFYGDLLGLHDRVGDVPERVTIIGGRDLLPMLSFQRVEDYRPPVYHDPARPQQMHFDLLFDDRPGAEARALELGATKLPPPGHDAAYADPAGHPFCILEPGD